MAVVDIPDSIADFFESNVLPLEQMREGHALACPPEASVAAHESLLKVSGILDRRKPGRKLPRRRLVSRSGRLLVEGFVRAFFVELFTEVIEAALLAAQCRGRRPCGLLLEGLVHTLMSAVLFGVTGFDEFGIDAEADPPDGESTQSADGGGGEGHSVIGANDLGKPVLLEEAAKDGLGALVCGRTQTMTTDDETRASIGDSEGVAVDAIARLELSLVVDAPSVVGSVHRLRWLPRMAGYFRLLFLSIMPCRERRSQTVERAGQSTLGCRRFKMTRSFFAPQ